MKIFFFAFIMALIVAMIVSINIPGNFELKLLGSILKVYYPNQQGGYIPNYPYPYRLPNPYPYPVVY
ncbi:hypothetical protein G4228_004475 [Cervus hanglu yarkandensis]|nr:hypothetical protein G4228_004475 [Cervus hanglu yarkandensis]